MSLTSLGEVYPDRSVSRFSSVAVARISDWLIFLWLVIRVAVEQNGGSVMALVRWATGKRLANRLPKLSLITLSPPFSSGILGLRMGPYVPSPKFFTISGDPGRVIYQILDMRKFTFL